MQPGGFFISSDEVDQRVWIICAGSQSVLFEPLDVVTEFERRSQLQSQILHHHLALQQQ